MTRWRLHMIVACLHMAACLHPRLIIAQVEYATWVFGDNAALTFDNGRGGMLASPRVMDRVPFSSLEGSAVYTDPCTREFTAYSNGVTIRDGKGREIPVVGGVGGGVSATQNGVFVRDPANRNRLYHVVTPCRSWPCVEGNLYYMVHHLERAGGRWMVLSSRRLYDVEGSERIAVTQDADLTGSWVVTLDVSGATTTLRAFHVTASGIAAEPVVSVIPTNVTRYGVMKFSPAGTQLAISNLSYAGVYLLDFDRASGACIRPRFAQFNASAGTLPLGLGLGASFSLRGTYVYWTGVASRGLEPEQALLMRFRVQDVVDDTTQVVPELVAVLDHRLLEQYDWVSMPQLGPNGKLYIPNIDALAVIHEPDAEVLDPASVDLHGVRLAPGMSAALGLPTCDESTFLYPTEQRLCRPPQAAISARDTCAGACTIVTVATSDDTTSVTCSFPGGVPPTWNGPFPPPICYARPGTYIMSVTARNANGNTTSFDTIVIRSGPPVKAGPDLRICTGGDAILSASGARMYQWTPASLLDDATSAVPTARGLRASTMFTVVGTDEFGCTSADSVLVTVGALEGSITGDTSVCEGATVAIEARGGTRCRWLDDTSIVSHRRIVRPFVTTTYTAVVDDGICADTVRTVVSVYTTPRPPTQTVFSTCPNEPVLLNIGASARHVRWEPADGLDDATSAAPFCTTTRSRWYVVLQRSADGCERRDTVLVNVDQAIDTIRVDTTVCQGETVTIAIADTSLTIHVERDEHISFDRPVQGQCWQHVHITVRHRPSSRTHVAVGTARAEVGEVVTIPIVITTTKPGSIIEVELQPTSSVRWSAPWTAPVRIKLADAEQVVDAIGTVMLTGDTARAIDVRVIDTARCSIASNSPGILRVDGCAIRYRQVSLLDALSIRAITSDHWTLSGGVGWRRAHLVSVLGEQELLAEGSGDLEIRLPERALRTPCYLVVSDDVQRHVIPMITP